MFVNHSTRYLNNYDNYVQAIVLTYLKPILNINICFNGLLPYCIKQIFILYYRKLSLPILRKER